MEETERTKRKTIYAAVLLLLLLLLTAGLLWMMGRGNETTVTSARSTGATSQPSGNAIKVGWMVSEWTSQEHPYGTPGNTENVTAIRQRFMDPEIELFAIIEPDTQDSQWVQGIVKKYFKSGHVVNGGDAEALSKLDVIVLSRDWNMRKAVMEGILKAVGNGTGLLRHLAAGISQREDDELMARINCIDEPKFFWTRETIDCRVVSDHPLLAGIGTTLPEGKLSIANVNGAIGIVHGIPLIVAEEGATSAHGTEAEGLPSTTGSTTNQSTSAPTDRRIFCPMFISQIGKGKVVACQWDSIPKPLVDATKGRFYIRCVQWLANRPVD
jgi:hypothetical protein